jgi:hypothetical protein
MVAVAVFPLGRSAAMGARDRECEKKVGARVTGVGAVGVFCPGDRCAGPSDSIRRPAAKVAREAGRWAITGQAVEEAAVIIRRTGHRERAKQATGHVRLRAKLAFLLLFWDFYFRALGSLVVLSFPQPLSFSLVLPKPLSETLTRSSDGRISV